MRISDWSSDVCSSDLQVPRRAVHFAHIQMVEFVAALVRAVQHAGVVREPGNGERRIGRRRGQGLRSAVARGECIGRSEEHTSELQSLMRISYAVFCLKKKRHIKYSTHYTEQSKSPEL